MTKKSKLADTLHPISPDDQKFLDTFLAHMQKQPWGGDSDYYSLAKNGDNLDAIEAEYKAAKAINEEQAYPLVANLNAAEQHYDDLFPERIKYALRDIKINFKIGSKGQIDPRRQRAARASRINRTTRFTGLRQKIDAQQAYDYCFQALHQIQVDWERARHGFEQRERRGA